jgi:hypothetical protein
MKLVGQIHNAKKVTFDGRDCWIAAICDEKRKLVYDTPNNVTEHETPEEASEFLKQEFRSRGVEFEIEIFNEATKTYLKEKI